MTLKDTITRILGISQPAAADASAGTPAEDVAATMAEDAPRTPDAAPESQTNAGSETTTTTPSASAGGAEAPTAANEG